MTDPVAHCMKSEFVIVTGAEDLYWGKQRHNKMMFAQSAVRYARLWGPQFDRTTVFFFNGACSTEKDAVEDGKVVGTYFADGHTPAQVAALKASVEKYRARFREVTSWSQVAAHINNRGDKINGCDKHVQALIFFCHGTPGNIWLSNTKREFLTSGNTSAVSASSFLPEAALSSRRYRFRHATSWACQTANGAVSGPFEKTVSASLAQNMADTWDIEVRASATRTLYSGVFAGGLGGAFKGMISGSRRMVDGCLWEDDGADGSVKSGPKGDAENLQQGMWKIEPGQRSNYQRVYID